MSIIQIDNKMKHFFKLFTKNTYSTFKNVLKYRIFLSNPNITDIAYESDKSITDINYFFNWAKWSYKLLNDFRIRWIRNKFYWCRDKISDILIMDSTIFGKNIWSSFWWKTRYFYSNSHKKVVNGFDFLWASISTTMWQKYMLDINMFVKNKKKKGKNQETKLWFRFLEKCVNKTKSWLIVLDSWFKSVKYVKYIRDKLNRHVLVRIDKKQYIIDESWKEKQINKLLIDKNAVKFTNWKMWYFGDVYLRSWFNWWFENKINIVVYWYNWAKNPSVLVTTAWLWDVYNNMIKKQWDLSWDEIQKKNEKWLILSSESIKVYSVFFLLYKQRWSIEVCFKELKSYFWFDKFKFKSYDSIMKYIHMCMLAHTLTSRLLELACNSEKWFNLVYNFLKKYRNIKNKCNLTNHKYITLQGMKLFLQMAFSWRHNFSSKLLNLTTKKTFSVSYQYCLELAK